ncbi:hypothetical protein NNJEOMEG_00094 [Fundidesulfovibrio magnetotacticus]|uniref:Uncharacterized protein n=1 Tax=Fundidesulfovibrio magnetotacticus TaxID=2730080 RepID=A0A6V8LHS6_9BACT|nr:SiaB family protein kinase [Fundidesulfovibrio magnetotacticus]GFK92272.1 hypothetical protein NNJEOMEG_00094 [Fundidesulfovibrio magnetotacticus]
MDLFRIRDAFGKAGIMICFNGPFSHSIIDEIGIAVRNHLTAQNLTKAAVLDVFAIFIELAQNVKNYNKVRDIPSDEASSAIITIARKDGRYAVTSGNVVHREDVAALTETIDSVNSLDAAGLRKLYKEQMRRATPPEALGAGLGILEMARRSTEKMTYAVSDMDGAMAFFSLTAYVSCKE